MQRSTEASTDELIGLNSLATRSVVHQDIVLDAAVRDVDPAAGADIKQHFVPY